MLFRAVRCLLILNLLFASVSSSVVQRTVKTSSGGTWGLLANITMNGVDFPRQEGSAALVGSDIYYLGGVIPVNTSTTAVQTIATVSKYSIPHDTWTIVAPMPDACNHCNVGVVNGKIYVLGGMNVTALGDPTFWNATGSSAVYDPITNVWTKLPDVPAGRAVGSAATMVVGETIYLPGGLLNTNLTNDEEGTVDLFSSYNTVTKQWTVLPTLPAPRDHAGKGVFGNTLYILAGRLDGHWNDTSTVFAYNIDTACWSTNYAPMPTGRGGAASATIGDLLIVAGGEGDPDTSTHVWPQTQAYDSIRNTWTIFSNMGVPVHGTSGVAYQGKMYIPAGGLMIGAGPSPLMQVFTPPP